MNAVPQGVARRVLLALTFAYVLNFLDRQMLGILAGPIKADLHLSDRQFGAVGGLAFALLYSLLGLPLSLLADRTSRSGVIAGALAVWSGFTALCGTAASFGQLFAYRLGVGVGEAGGVAPSYALIADHFPPATRGRALAFYSLGVPVGLAAGTLFGAYLAALVSWRAAFVTMGAIGLAYAPLFRRLVRDRPRSGSAPSTGALGAALAAVARKPSFWLLAFASSCSSLAGYGLALWTPSILERSFGLAMVARGQFFASLLLIGGVAGVMLGGVLADRLGRARGRWYALLPAIAWLVTAPLFTLGLNAQGLTAAWLWLLVPNALNILWLGPVTTAVQGMVPAEQRATASSAFLVINNLIGLGAGPLLIGALSDRLKAVHGAEALRIAATEVLAFYLLAALLALVAATRVERDMIGD
ncbi:MFS transporter [Sphingomonas sp. ASV193]|uniref:spinster family MFS transporter n=1 Tax=Sphingomonas sp. ASV193 TaxID=3144405 RepID=UPI0032E90733